MNANISDALSYIDPAGCSYQEWINIGMALKEDGHSVSDWDSWSRRDSKRYHVGECEKKWRSFQGAGNPVTVGTIIAMAKGNGYQPLGESRELDWEDEISTEIQDGMIVNPNWVEGKEITEPKSWSPVQDLITYLETLFESTENVGYVTQSYETNGKSVPTKGCWDRTAGELIQQLNKCGGDIGSVLGDYDPEAGAWIRFNPLDGKGIKNDNVTDFRYALVESDTTDIEKQNAIIRELELPVACLVHSGKKSIHAIVRIDAADYSEYRKRVDYLYDICRKNGLEIDQQNRNPSRLSRMPGVMRNGQKQYLIDTNIGKSNFLEWKDWIESVTDDLPDTENLSDVWNSLPELAPALIDGILRQGHKMLIAGPSKAGKSFALIELCIAIAEGGSWFHWKCTQGRVLYVNLELDRASCLHRFSDVYTALGLQPKHIFNIDIWNLRGKTIPMDKLAPKLIRRAAKKKYIAIVIDPIYKIITGDENSADQMAHFCNQFDKVCTELGCAVIYCHHHSKGSQSGKKSMDRASGSGVFARDPDALLDLIELDLNEEIQKQQQNKLTAEISAKWLKRFQPGMELSQDDLFSASAMTDLCRKHLPQNSYHLMQAEIKNSLKGLNSRTAWRIDGTLREFPKFDPLNLWFDYPIHRIDDSGVLQDVEFFDAAPPWKSNFKKKKSSAERKTYRNESIETAIQACNIDGNVTIKEVAEYMGVTEKTVRRRIKEQEKYIVMQNEITLRDRDKVE